MSSKKKVQQWVLGSLANLENDEQLIVRVLSVRGGNMVGVELSDGSEMLCDIPSRLAKKIWMKRGDFLIVELYTATITSKTQKESKIKAVVVHVLNVDSIKQLKRDGVWPTQFEVQIPDKAKFTQGSSNGLSSNPNRPPSFDSDSEDDGKGGDSDEEDSLDLPPNQNRKMPPGSSSDEE
jgi:probable RNA-binding protein EIF1AD